MLDKKPLVIFDLDGTLVDSAPDLVDALNAVLARDNIPPLPLAQARKFVGRGGRVLIRLGLEASGVSVTDARVEEMFVAFLAQYEQHLADKTLPYPGVVAALDRLAEAGYLLAVCTNKFEKPAAKLLRELALSDRFAAIVGADTFAVSKPNGAVLRLTAERAGASVEQMIMVGDTLTDIKAARDARVPVVCVDFGYEPEELASLAPDRIISHFDELAPIVDELCAAIRRAA